jgi:hypothetical protein
MNGSTRSHWSAGAIGAGMSFSAASKEMAGIIRRLQSGSVLTKFYNKGKPERKTFFVSLETRQLVWTTGSVDMKSGMDGLVDLREVKEVRIGPISKIMDKMLEEDVFRKWDKQQCLSLLYGQQFRLKTLSCIGRSHSLCHQLSQ